MPFLTFLLPFSAFPCIFFHCYFSAFFSAYGGRSQQEPGYTEAGAWQYRVEVPYDPTGLYLALKGMGYDGCDIIQEANTMQGAFHAGGYGGEIHEARPQCSLAHSLLSVASCPSFHLPVICFFVHFAISIVLSRRHF